MNEEYIREKIKEFDERLKEEEQYYEFLRNELSRIIETKEQYKDLVKKLKDLDGFKENLEQQIKRENDQVIKDTIEDLTKKIDREAKSTLNIEIKRLSKITDNLERQSREILDFKDQVKKNQEKSTFDEVLCKILIEELEHERVFSKEEADRIIKRASIRTSKILSEK